MRHPESLLVPAMMLADYYLTVYAAVLRDRGHGLHFRLEHFELNPRWQKAVAQKRWFNPRHLALATGASLLLIGLLEFVPELGRLAGFLLGTLLGAYGLIIARHISNILVFRRLIRHPGEVTGEVAMAPAFAIASSCYQIAGLALPLGMIAVFARSSFALGSLLGAVVLVHVHWRWLRRAERQAGALPDGQTPP
jgi:hypothetical protein